mgnify:CR=1 FL=1
MVELSRIKQEELEAEWKSLQKTPAAEREGLHQASETERLAKEVATNELQTIRAELESYRNEMETARNATRT